MMPRKKKPVAGPAQSKKRIEKLAEIVRREVRSRLGPDATFEQRRDAAAAVMTEALWKDEDQELRESTTDDEEIDVDDKRYRRLGQRSSATYYGRWGPHAIEEPLYREVGVHDGPTVKPLEVRMGMIARHMTPDLARIVGELSAHGSSREVEQTMRATGLVPPSRAFLEKRVKCLAGEIAQQAEQLEEAARSAEPPSSEIAAMSCGMDRMAVRMSEPLDPETAPPSQSYRARPSSCTATTRSTASCASSDALLPRCRARGPRRGRRWPMRFGTFASAST
jgi:hypothetical protein